MNMQQDLNDLPIFTNAGVLNITINLPTDNTSNPLIMHIFALGKALWYTFCLLAAGGVAFGKVVEKLPLRQRQYVDSNSGFIFKAMCVLAGLISVILVGIELNPGPSIFVDEECKFYEVEVPPHQAHETALAINMAEKSFVGTNVEFLIESDVVSIDENEFLSNLCPSDVTDSQVGTIYGKYASLNWCLSIGHCVYDVCACGLSLEKRLNTLSNYLKRSPTTRELLDSFNYDTIRDWANFKERVFVAQMSDKKKVKEPNLRELNMKNFRTPKKVKLADAISRELAIAKRCAKTAARQAKRDFQAQMFDLAVPIKLDSDQYDKITDLAEKLIGVSETITGKGKENQEWKDNLREMAGGIAQEFGKQTVAGATEQLSTLLQTFCDKLSSSYGKPIVIVVIAALLVTLFKRCESKKAFIGACLAISMSLGYIYRVELKEAMQAVIERLTGGIKTDEEFFEAQMFDPTMLADLLTLFLGYTLIPGFKDKKTNWLKVISDIGRCRDGVEEVVQFVLRLLQKMLDYVATQFGYKSFTLMGSMIPRVDAWLDDTRNFLTDFGAGKKGKDMKTFDEVLALEDRAYELLAQYARDRRSGVGPVIRPLSNELSRIRYYMQQLGVGQHKMRQAPVIISLSGESQIGKSRSLRPLVASLLAMVLTPEELAKVREDFDSHVYSRQPEHEFWDGYCGQLVCFYDEKDLAHPNLLSATNASTDFIRIGNVFPNVLHMASLEQKGNTYFRSKIVIATTNVDTAIAGAKDSVRYPAAVANRIHFECSVRVKREFATAESLANPDSRYWCLDKSKLKGEGFQWGIHDIVMIDRKAHPEAPGFVTYEPGETIEVDELLRRAARKYKQLAEEAAYVSIDDAKAFARGSVLKELDAAFEHGKKVGEAQMMGDYMPLMTPEVFIYLLESGADVNTKVKCAKNLPYVVGEATIKDTFKVFLAKNDRAPKYPQEALNQFCMRFPPAQLAIVMEEFEKDPFAAHVFLTAWKDTAVELTFWDKLVANYASITARVFLPLTSMWTSWVALEWKWMNNLFGTSLPYLVKLIAICYINSYVISFLIKIVGSVCETFLDYIGFGKKKEVEQPVAQLKDAMLEDIAMKIWKGNYYGILFDDHRVGWGFFTHDNVFNLCAHYINVWKARGHNGVNVILKNSKEEIKVPIEVLFSFQKKGEDWCAGVIENCRKHADIRPLMGDVKMFARRGAGSCMLMSEEDGVLNRIYADFKVSYSIFYVDPEKNPYKLAVALEYNVPTKKGDCGLPIFIVDPSTRCQKFVGFHVAGMQGLGLCMLFPPVETAAVEAQAAFVPATMRVIGKVDRAPGGSGKSKIMKSPLYEKWGPALKAPAHLGPFMSNGQRIYPMDRALARYDQPVLTYPEDLVKVCCRASIVANTSGPAFKVLPVRITMEEAILGIPGVEFIDSVNRSTSPGYPWNMKPRTGYKGKERFFGQGPDIDLSGPDWPELKKQIEEAHEMLKQGKRPNFYFTDALKDELLKLSKVMNGDTRLFCPSPIVYYVLFNMYFRDIVRKFMESKISGEHAVGINVYSIDWELLFRRLTRFGLNNIVAGDFSTFDALQAAQILKEIGEAIIECFGDREYDSIRRLLWMEVWNSKHIVGTNIYEWLQSLPSGHPATTFINSIFVGVVMRMAWVKAHQGRLEEVRSFTDHVSLTSFGDDNGFGVSDAKKDIFNQRTVTQYMAELGLKYTAENKEDNPPPLRSIYDIEFLKRKFRYEPRYGRHAAPLRMASILEMPYWTKVEYSDGIWKQNFENALRELSLHPESVFNEWAPRMIRAALDAGYQPIITDRGVLLDEIVKKEIQY